MHGPGINAEYVLYSQLSGLVKYDAQSWMRVQSVTDGTSTSCRVEGLGFGRTVVTNTQVWIFTSRNNYGLPSFHHCVSCGSVSGKFGWPREVMKVFDTHPNRMSGTELMDV